MSGLSQAYNSANKHNHEHPGDKLKVKHVKNFSSSIDATGTGFFMKPLSFYYQNARSIKSENKCLVFKENLSLRAVPIDIIVLTETWLSDKNDPSSTNSRRVAAL